VDTNHIVIQVVILLVKENKVGLFFSKKKENSKYDHPQSAHTMQSQFRDAVRKGDLATVKSGLLSEEVNIADCGEFGMGTSVLYDATIYGHIPVLKALLEVNPDYCAVADIVLRYPSEGHYYPPNCLLQNRDLQRDILTLLFDLGYKPNNESLTQYIRSGTVNKERLEMLLKIGFQVNETALTAYVLRKDQTSIAFLLIQSHQAINLSQGTAQTAAEEIPDYSLSAKMSIYKKYKNETFNPNLDWKSISENKAIFIHFVDTILHQDIERMRAFINDGMSLENISHYLLEPSSLLYYPVKNRGYEAVELLLSLGIKPVYEDSARNSLLHIAARNGDDLMLKKLITVDSAHAVNKPNFMRDTPLICAIDAGNIQCVSALINQTLEKIDLLNTFQKSAPHTGLSSKVTASRYAEYRGETEIANYIKLFEFDQYIEFLQKNSLSGLNQKLIEKMQQKIDDVSEENKKLHAELSQYRHGDTALSDQKTPIKMR
jgi:hypothetical protein